MQLAISKDRKLRTFRLSKLPGRIADRVLMWPVFPALLGAVGREPVDKSWVFVLGCYNSGTTLLAEILQAHERLDGMRNEGAFLTDSLPYPEKLGWPRMWCRCEDKLKEARLDVDTARRIRRQWGWWIRGNPEYVVEKSVSNVLRIDFLNSFFSNAKFVHIVRNGYAVAAGIRNKANLKRWKNPEQLEEYPIEMCAHQWSRSLQLVEQAAECGVDIITLKYEDLTRESVAAMTPVFDYIGVEPIQDPSRWGQLSVHEKVSEIRDMNAGSLALLRNDDVERIDSVAGKKLREYGYGA